MVTNACYTGSQNDRIGDLPPREQVILERGWRAAHAFDTGLPGWLVLAPTRHVSALHELTPEEALARGDLLVKLSAALHTVLGCEKTYVALFAETEGFAHLHYHVVPRMAWFAQRQVGPRVFSFLGKSEAERVPPDQQDALAEQIAAALLN